MNEIKNTLIEDIKDLIKTNKNEVIEINPKFLDFFTKEELESIRDDLVNKKLRQKESNSLFLDEIYEKTKKDKI
ncbi:MAG: hypothetical protein MJK08_11640 [Campylobacterales bacterium]|nr:hypothetical protein [Campylobacterales bacterium]NQY53483.1 hypothetical protein [Campylobacteraceae bacterium]